MTEGVLSYRVCLAQLWLCIKLVMLTANKSVSLPHCSNGKKSMHVMSRLAIACVEISVHAHFERVNLRYRLIWLENNAIVGG